MIHSLKLLYLTTLLLTSHQSQFEMYSLLFLFALSPNFAKSGPILETSALEFLRKYGYLESNSNNASDSLISQERISHAVKIMQEFGGLEQTGELDEDTLSLMTKSRCGVEDIVPKDRNGRFALGSKGWNKNNLSYRLENLSPQLNPRQADADLQKAMGLWARYSQLKFRKVSTKDDEVDIAISFGRRDHGDSYPFDGQGGTLAHAFYPQNRPGLSGDIHFDEEERWAHNSSQGLSFLQVAAHELGHSLGLGHSPRETSIMFPYYQQSGEEPKLDEDDIMALYYLYVSKGQGAEPEKRTTTEKITSTTRPSRSPSTTIRSEDRDQPNVCDGYDSIGFIRNEIFVFKGHWMWRFEKEGQLLKGGNYPAKFSRLFSSLEGVMKVDAAFEKGDDIIFISGNKYWTLKGSKEGRPLTDFGLPENVSIDAAFVWGKNSATYFFQDHDYWRYNDTTKSIAVGYPLKIEDRWRGIPNHISSVLTYREGKTYFFRDNKVWRFNDAALKSDESYGIKNVRVSWFGCSS